MQEIKISLAAARVNSGLDYEDFAAKLGVAPEKIAEWESGQGEPNASQLRKISELSNIPMDYIFIQE